MSDDDPSKHLADWAAHERESHARAGRVAQRHHRELLQKESGWRALVDRITADAACVRLDTNDGRTITGLIREHGDGFIAMQMAGVMRAIIPLHGILALSTAISCETITHGFPPAHTSRPLGDALEELVAERLVAKISLASSTVQHQGEISHVATDFITLRHQVGPQGNTHIPFARISSIIFENDF